MSQSRVSFDSHQVYCRTISRQYQVAAKATLHARSTPAIYSTHHIEVAAPSPTMPAATLHAIAIRLCGRALLGITDVSDIPYEILRPVLRKITNPAHLHAIELNSPQIADEDAELWRAFIARDIPNHEEKLKALGEPRNQRSWWKVHRKLVREEAARREAQEQELERVMGGMREKREEGQVRVVHSVIPGGEPAGRPAFIDGVPNRTLQPSPFGSGALKKGQNVMGVLKRQAAVTMKARVHQPKYPAAYGEAQTRGVVLKAPEWMVREQSQPKSAMATVQARTERVRALEAGRLDSSVKGIVFAPRKAGRTQAERVLDEAEEARVREREARLRGFTEGKGAVKAVPAAPAVTDRPAGARPLPRPTPAPSVLAKTTTTTIARPLPAPASSLSKTAPAPSAMAARKTLARPLPTPAPTPTPSDLASSTTSPRPYTPLPASPAPSRLGISSPLKRLPSPSPAPLLLKKRPAAGGGVFMPVKKRKVV